MIFLEEIGPSRQMIMFFTQYAIPHVTQHDEPMNSDIHIVYVWCTELKFSQKQVNMASLESRQA